jgi:hypothetical protein
MILRELTVERHDALLWAHKRCCPIYASALLYVGDLLVDSVG